MNLTHIKLAVLSLLALAFGAPVGFRTANAEVPVALDALKVPELKELAAKHDVDLPPDAKRDDILNALVKAGVSPQPLADKVEDAVLGKPVEDNRPLDEQVASLRAELAAVRAAVPVPIAPPSVLPNATSLLIAGAGVKSEDVQWRINAGLTAAQAVEVALQEKNEAAAKKEAKK